MKFKCLHWVSGEGRYYFGSGVCERDVFVYECDEASATSTCSVLSECSVPRKLRGVLLCCEFSFLDKGYVYVVFDEDVFEFLYFVCDPINVYL